MTNLEIFATYVRQRDASNLQNRKVNSYKLQDTIFHGSDRHTFEGMVKWAVLNTVGVNVFNFGGKWLSKLWYLHMLLYHSSLKKHIHALG